jgi:serine/threonine protein kinase
MNDYLMRCIGGGDLRVLVYDATQLLKLSEMVQFMVEISNGMTHLHRHDIVHRFVVDILLLKWFFIPL